MAPTSKTAKDGREVVYEAPACPLTCVQCQQKYGDIDKYATGMDIELRWRVFNESKRRSATETKVMVATGSECYYCWDVRRNDWSDYTVADLTEERDTDAEVNNRFEKLRTAKALGESLPKRGEARAATKVESKEGNFEE